MADFDWDSMPDSESAKAPKFDWDSLPDSGPKVSMKDRPSKIETGARALAQGASAGFSDELSGGLEAAGRAVGLKGFGQGFSDWELADAVGLNMDELSRIYKEQRNKYRGVLKEDAKENPTTAMVGNLAGAVVSPINKVGKGLSLAKQGALLGGIGGYGLSEEESIGGQLLDTAKGAALGGVVGKGAEKATNAVQSASQKLANFIEPAKRKEGVEAIRDAADRMGVRLTPGMLDGSGDQLTPGLVERLESSLAKSPSFLGRMVARNQQRVVGRLNDAGEALLQNADNSSPYQLGEKFKSDVTAKVGERLDPLVATFDEVAESTRHIPVGEKSVSAIKRNIESLPSYRLSGGAGKPSQYVDMLQRVRNADDVKQVMTLLNSDIRAAQGAEKNVLLQIKDKFSNLEKNSIMRAAIKTAKESGSRNGDSIGSGIVEDLKLAREGYRNLANDLKSVSENARLKMDGGPSSFLNRLEEIPSERIPEKFFNTKNVRQLQSLKEKFPEQFDALANGKLGEILQKSQNPGIGGQNAFEFNRFLKEAKKLHPEARQMLFGKNAMQVIDDMQTIQGALPRNFNPSGTASEASWNEAVYRNLKDIPTFMLYKGASSNLAKNISDNLLKVPRMADLYKKNPAAFQNLVNQLEQNAGIIRPQSPVQLPRAADGEGEVSKVPSKGPEKWMNDGADKLKAHGMKDQALLESLRSSRRGRDLLMQASDLKPGSAQMERLFSQIKKQKGRG